MEDEQPVRVMVEIQHTDKTVSGQVAVEGVSKPTGFFGWVELDEALERAAAREPRGSLQPGAGVADAQ